MTRQSPTTGTGRAQAAKRHAAKGKLPQASEAAILKAILAMLDLHPRVGWFARMNTGAARMGTEAGAKGRYVRFSFAGCSDIIGQLTDGRFLALEVKSKTGRLTGDQSHFLSQVNRYGGLGFVARSVDDVLAVLPMAGDPSGAWDIPRVDLRT